MKPNHDKQSKDTLGLSFNTDESEDERMTQWEVGEIDLLLEYPAEDSQW